MSHAQSLSAQRRRRLGAVQMFSVLRIWAFRRRSRAQLAALPPQMLRDIGVTPHEAAQEAAKPFWRR